jgi:hypothetical protein
MDHAESESGPTPYHWDPPPPDFYDPVIEYYKQFVDREALRENLRLTVDQRFEKLKERIAGEKARRAEETFPMPDAVVEHSGQRLTS